eukprot:5245163-Pyramimonas_sp.AAC.1
MAADAMHTIDSGVTSHILGNTFYEIVYEQIGGRATDAVGRLWREIKQVYVDIGSTGHKLSFNSWRSSAEPFFVHGGAGVGGGGGEGVGVGVWAGRCVTSRQRVCVLGPGPLEVGQGRGKFGLIFFLDTKSPHSDYPVMTTKTKAAAQRALIPVAAQLAATYDDNTTMRSMRSACIANLNTFYKITESAGMYLSEREYQDCISAAERTLVFYSALASEAKANNVFKWSIVNKFHHFWHIAQGTRFINCRMLWRYQAEDFMRHIGKVASCVMMGSSLLELSKKLCERWRIGY